MKEWSALENLKNFASELEVHISNFFPSLLMEDEVLLGRRVMVAVDESEESMYALQWALDHLLIIPADNKGDSVCADRIILMHAETPALSKVALTGQVAFTGHVLEILKRSQNLNTQRVLSRSKGICEKFNVSVETKVVDGETRYAICEAANKLRIDLLVVGSHGYGALQRAVRGSVSDYCRHHVKCPVVVVKRQDQ
eukprot:Gb_20331 [translate_table: standard]